LMCQIPLKVALMEQSLSQFRFERLPLSKSSVSQIGCSEATDQYGLKKFIPQFFDRVRTETNTVCPSLATRRWRNRRTLIPCFRSQLRRCLSPTAHCEKRQEPGLSVSEICRLARNPTAGNFTESAWQNKALEERYVLSSSKQIQRTIIRWSIRTGRDHIHRFQSRASCIHE
jgi:hypothetical protein